jgi:hypothetical protein
MLTIEELRKFYDQTVHKHTRTHAIIVFFVHHEFHLDP